ncbi:MAG: FeoB-associated Cys-rich membrane protein [Coriobacteriales bacterium]|nr:FeoB-associated Cys-rich membrane protein [Coriobacteriales bacterium]
MAATIIISLLVLAAVLLAIRSVVRSRKAGGCDSCGDSGPCPACTPYDLGPDVSCPRPQD